MKRFVQRLLSRRGKRKRSQYTFVKRKHKDGRMSPLFLNYLQSSGYMKPLRRHSTPFRLRRRLGIFLAGLFLLFLLYILIVSIRALALF